MKKILITLLGIGLLTAVGTAQMAPRDTAKAMLGGHSVAVEYGQPALKGRDLGALVSQLPEDRMWRAGSEQVTTFTAEAPVMVGNKTIPAGTYSVYIHCDDNNAFSFVLNEVVGQPLVPIDTHLLVFRPHTPMFATLGGILEEGLQLFLFIYDRHRADSSGKVLSGQLFR